LLDKADEGPASVWTELTELLSTHLTDTLQKTPVLAMDLPLHLGVRLPHLVQWLRTILRQTLLLGEQAVDEPWTALLGTFAHLLGASALKLLVRFLHLLVDQVAQEAVHRALAHWTVLAFASHHERPPMLIEDIVHTLPHALHPLHHLSEDATTMSLPAAEAMAHNGRFIVSHLNFDFESLVGGHHRLLWRVLGEAFDVLEQMAHDVAHSAKRTDGVVLLLREDDRAGECRED